EPPHRCKIQVLLLKFWIFLLQCHLHAFSSALPAFFCQQLSHLNPRTTQYTSSPCENKQIAPLFPDWICALHSGPLTYLIAAPTDILFVRAQRECGRALLLRSATSR